MKFADIVARVKWEYRQRTGWELSRELDLTQSERHEPSSSAARLAAAAQTPIAEMTFAHEGRTLHKWLHYPDIYERHFGPYRGKPIRMLEIGVFQGGSLQLWREYFGPEATIFGVDVNPDCASRVDAPNQVRIGSQADATFLRSVVAEMGGIDIVLDDGSHVAEHQEATFKTLFPLLNTGGIYAIEDLHTAYWPEHYNGGYRRQGTAIELLKDVVDDMHGWYHRKDERRVSKSEIGGLHFYDSIAFLDKCDKEEPRHIEIPALKT